jgi:hypothetical protein
VQAAHAAYESTKNFGTPNIHPNIIICSVKSEHKLNQVGEYLLDKNIQYTPFREPDIGNQLTAIATCPLYGDQRNIMRKFQLLKGGESSK